MEVWSNKNFWKKQNILLKTVIIFPDIWIFLLGKKRQIMVKKKIG